MPPVLMAIGKKLCEIYGTPIDSAGDISNEQAESSDLSLHHKMKN